MTNTLSRTLRAIVPLLLMLSASFAQEKSSKAFTIGEPELVPEGIAYDRRTKIFYVSSTYLRKIVSIDQKGTVKNFTTEGQNGLRGVLGMRVDVKRRVLWAISSHFGNGMPIKNADRDCVGCSEVLKYNVDTGALIKKYSLPNKPDPHFVNDITIASNGDVYLTDTVYGAVYMIRSKGDGELTELVRFEKESYPNGLDLSADERWLFVAVDGKIAAIDLQSRQINYLTTPKDLRIGIIDGMYFHDNSLIAIQPFEPGKAIVRYRLNKQLDAIELVEVIEASHALMNQPTTGTVVGNDLYYIANSQLQAFRRMYRPDGSFDKAKLSEIFILKVRM